LSIACQFSYFIHSSIEGALDKTPDQTAEGSKSRMKIKTQFIDGFGQHY